MNHEIVEKRVGLMGVLIAVVISMGGLVEIVPLYFQGASSVAAPGVKPYEALQFAGRDVYVREGCYNCQSQMIRPFRADTERYGPYSLAGESVYDHPFQFGSKRTGPDLPRVGGHYSDEWHRVHFTNPRDVVPESNMPAYPWLAKNKVDIRTSWVSDDAYISFRSLENFLHGHGPVFNIGERVQTLPTRCGF